MITLVSRDRSSDQACEIKRAADEICRPQGKKVRNAFQQRVNNVDWYKECEKNEEGTMIRVIVRLVIDGSVNIAFPRKQ